MCLSLLLNLGLHSHVLVLDCKHRYGSDVFLTWAHSITKYWSCQTSQLPPGLMIIYQIEAIERDEDFPNSKICTKGPFIHYVRMILEIFDPPTPM